MAEAIFEERLVRGYPHLFPLVKVHSAGTAAIEGNRVTERAVQAMDLWGIDISNHRAHALTTTMIEEADLVLALAREHLLSIGRISGEALGKVFPLKYVTSLKEEILDNLGVESPREEDDLKSRLVRVRGLVLDIMESDEDFKVMGHASSDIIDPIGGTLETYLTVAEEINSAVIDLMYILFGEAEE